MTQEEMALHVRSIVEDIDIPRDVKCSVKNVLQGVEIRISELHRLPISTTIEISSIIDNIVITRLHIDVFDEMVLHHIRNGIEMLRKAQLKKIVELVSNARSSISNQGIDICISPFGVNTLDEVKDRLLEMQDVTAQPIIPNLPKET